MLLNRPIATALRTSEGTMLGNDVVDLRDPDSNAATHPARFDARVFSPREHTLIRHSPHASRLRWQLWSAKEAAFKAARKRSAAAIFSPPRFEVELSSSDHGRVYHHCDAQPLESFEIRWWHDADAVHAVALSGDIHARDPGTLVHGFRRGAAPGLAGRAERRPQQRPPWDPSSAVRHFACEELACQLAVAPHSLEVRTKGRVPELWLDGHGRLAGASLSLSHHGDWLAFACWIDTTLHPCAASARQRWAS